MTRRWPRPGSSPARRASPGSATKLRRRIVESSGGLLEPDFSRSSLGLRDAIHRSEEVLFEDTKPKLSSSSPGGDDTMSSVFEFAGEWGPMIAMNIGAFGAGRAAVRAGITKFAPGIRAADDRTAIVVKAL